MTTVIPLEKSTQKPDKASSLDEQDEKIIARIEHLINRLKSSEAEAQLKALESLRAMLKVEKTSSSINKAIRLMGNYYNSLKEIHISSVLDEKAHKKLPTLMSFLAMISSEANKDDCLEFFLKSEELNQDVGFWGNEFIRYLSCLLIEQIQNEDNIETNPTYKDLAHKIAAYSTKHNSESDAVDILLESDQVEKIVKLCSKENYNRVALYMESLGKICIGPLKSRVFEALLMLHLEFKEYSDALIVSVRLNDIQKIETLFLKNQDTSLTNQFAILLARSNITLNSQVLNSQQLASELVSNGKIHDFFNYVVKELQLDDPKSPEDIYKSHLELSGRSIPTIDTTKQNLAATYVSAFVNCCYCNDSLIINNNSENGGSGNNTWIYKNKDNGKTSVVAALGMLHMFDIENGLALIDKYMYSSDEHIQAGALLAIGILTNKINNDTNPTLALLSDQLDTNKSENVRFNALLALGISYICSNNNEVVDILTPVISNTALKMELSSIAALSAGLTYTGTSDGDLASTILTTMMEREEDQLQDQCSRFMGLGLALLYLGRQDEAEATLETLKAIEHPLSKEARILVDGCAYMGSGDVNKVQELMQNLKQDLKAENEEASDSESDSCLQYTIVAIALVSLGEQITVQMTYKLLAQFTHYGNSNIRQAVSLALALLYCSNPQIEITETLSRLSHDHNPNVALNAIFSLGIVGCGTNNARIAKMLRQLAVYYSKDTGLVFIIRIAQGILHLGKGALTISPISLDSKIINKPSLASVLSLIMCLIDDNKLITTKLHSLMYLLSGAIYPRYLVTVDENLNPISTQVRVGQAVDIVGQAGKRKKISGFQTNQTPVLLMQNERAELATEEYIPMTSVLENIVIVKKNENYVADSHK